MTAFLTTRPDLIDRIKTEAANIRTVHDLLDYARKAPSPITGEILLKAAGFFMEDCRREEGGIDWKAVRERKRIGLRRRLDLRDQLSSEICQAFLKWILHRGRDLGTSFLEAMLSQSEGGISEPRYYAQDLLREIARRSGSP